MGREREGESRGSRVSGSLLAYAFPKLAATALGHSPAAAYYGLHHSAEQLFACGLPCLRQRRTEWLGPGDSQGPLGAVPRNPKGWAKPDSVYTPVSAGSISWHWVPEGERVWE